MSSFKDYTFAIVDTETTGTSPTYNEIIEIAILRVEKGILVDSYKTLIKPTRGVPEFITSVTGLRNQDLLHAPAFEEVALVIKEKLEGAIFVAHNARFDYGFLKNEFRRLSISFQAKTLCTVKLSRLLYPEEPHHNLDSIIERFKLVCAERHRAYDDALMLWKFLQKVDKKIKPEVVTHALEQCLGSATLPGTLSKKLVSTLPTGAGVYIFYGKDREVLYVGKSINIKTRVMSHFSGDHQSSRELTLCSQVYDIDARVTTGELSALFLESKLIKELSPVYNRMLRKVKKLAVIEEIQTTTGYKTTLAGYKDTLDPSQLGHVLGVFRTLRQAKEVLLTSSREHALCPKLLGLEHMPGACFQSQLEKCYGACVGKEEAMLYNRRFDLAFKKRRLRAWPYKGPIVIKEEVEEYEGTAYVIDTWCIQKVITFADGFYEESDSLDISFEYDSYKILARHLLKPSVRRSVVPYQPQ